MGSWIGPNGIELIQDFWSQGAAVAALGAVWVSES